MDQGLLVSRFCNRELVYGEGLLFGKISFISITILFVSKYKRERGLLLFYECSITYWNKIGFWFSWRLGLVTALVVIYCVVILDLVWNNESVWNSIGFWIVRRARLMAFGDDQCIEEISATEVLMGAAFSSGYSSLAIGWQVKFSSEKLWFGILRKRRSTVWSVPYRLMWLHGQKYLSFTLRFLFKKQGLDTYIYKESISNSEFYKGAFVIVPFVECVKQFRILRVLMANNKIFYNEDKVWLQYRDSRRKYKNIGRFGFFNMNRLKIIRSCVVTVKVDDYSWKSLVWEHKLRLIWLDREQNLRFWIKWNYNWQWERDFWRGVVLVLVWWSWSLGICWIAGWHYPCVLPL